MYNLNNPMPAPYELNQSQQMQQPQGFSRGGRAKKHEMILAHFNPHELNILDHLQGKTESKSGVRSYSHLEELLKNPHIVTNVHHHARRHHANGGGANMQHLAHDGRYGDSMLGMIGPHTHHLFNQLADHATRNPQDGHPEYWSLGKALGGLWNTIKGSGHQVVNTLKGVGRAAAPHLMPMAQQALTNKFGDMGTTMGSFLPGMTEKAFGPSTQQNSALSNALGEGLGKAANAYNTGASASSAFGQGLSHLGNSGIAPQGLSGAMKGLGQGLGQGQGFGEAAKAGLQGGMNGLREEYFNNPTLMNGVAS